MIMVQMFIALALLAVVFVYAVLALADVDDRLDSLGYLPSERNESEAPGDE